MERPVLAYLILKETLVRLLDILRKICVEHKRWYLSVGKLRYILYLYVLALRGWRGVCLYEGQHLLVELGELKIALLYPILLGCMSLGC